MVGYILRGGRNFFAFLQKSEKKLERALRLLNEWLEENLRAFIVYFNHATGQHFNGTKNLRDKISLYSEQWSRAVVLDTQMLNSENLQEKLSVAAPKFDRGKIISGVMKYPSTAPRLVMPFDVCNEKENRTWIVPQIKRRIIEEMGKEPVTDV